MTAIQPHKSGARKRQIRLATIGLFIIGVLGAIVLDAPPASADAGVHTLGSTPYNWAPYVSGTVHVGTHAAPTNLTISCYVTGDSVSGPYGAENVWDEVSSPWAGGTFVPDALIYTGSNSPVVPACGTKLGTTISIGGANITISYDPASGSPDFAVTPGVKLEIQCYTTGVSVTGPYGPENIWDRTVLLGPFAQNVYLPDADVYTGSNSAVVPHC